MGLEKENENPH
jgi:hypothetical protein